MPNEANQGSYPFEDEVRQFETAPDDKKRDMTGYLLLLANQYPDNLAAEEGLQAVDHGWREVRIESALGSFKDASPESRQAFAKHAVELLSLPLDQLEARHAEWLQNLSDEQKKLLTEAVWNKFPELMDMPEAGDKRIQITVEDLDEDPELTKLNNEFGDMLNGQVPYEGQEPAAATEEGETEEAKSPEQLYREALEEVDDSSGLRNFLDNRRNEAVEAIDNRSDEGREKLKSNEMLDPLLSNLESIALSGELTKAFEYAEASFSPKDLPAARQMLERNVKEAVNQLLTGAVAGFFPVAANQLIERHPISDECKRDLMTLVDVKFAYWIDNILANGDDIQRQEAISHLDWLHNNLLRQRIISIFEISEEEINAAKLEGELDDVEQHTVGPNPETAKSPFYTIYRDSIKQAYARGEYSQPFNRTDYLYWDTQQQKEFLAAAREESYNEINRRAFQAEQYLNEHYPGSASLMRQARGHLAESWVRNPKGKPVSPMQNAQGLIDAHKEIRADAKEKVYECLAPLILRIAENIVLGTWTEDLPKDMQSDKLIRDFGKPPVEKALKFIRDNIEDTDARTIMRHALGPAIAEHSKKLRTPPTQPEATAIRLLRP